MFSHFISIFLFVILLAILNIFIILLNLFLFNFLFNIIQIYLGISILETATNNRIANTDRLTVSRFYIWTIFFLLIVILAIIFAKFVTLLCSFLLDWLATSTFLFVTTISFHIDIDYNVTGFNNLIFLISLPWIIQFLIFFVHLPFLRL